ncbi:MAG TPA: helix-turn-helix transcriptional regulator [Solirubrobacterales bacterium]|jgi:transcriptional regulator with XRE-family HTH domain
MLERREALECFGRNLHLARGRAGLSQAALARRVGVSRAYIGKVEAGDSECRFVTAMRLAGAVGIGIDELFEGIPIWTPHPDRTIHEERGE